MKKFLLVTRSDVSQWSETARLALQTRGEVFIEPSLQGGRRATAGCALVVIDATGQHDLKGEIRAARQQAPEALVVVAAAAPTFQTIRNAVLSGANELIVKSSQTEFLNRLDKLFAQQMRGPQETAKGLHWGAAHPPTH